METKTGTKTISRGTLGLRFMQNAQRAKQLKEVAFEQAEVKDDGQWEVDQKIRDSWGPASQSSSSQTIEYETSYLPFMFSSEASTSSEIDLQKPKGRRVFNKHGVEEAVKEEPETTTAEISDQKRPKIHPRPKAISGSAGLFGFPDEAPSKSKNAKTAQQLIHDNTGVGEDLRSSKKRSVNASPASTPALEFLKPAGVDDPKDTRLPQVKDTKSDIIIGARSKKAKRERPSTDQLHLDEDTKRKKKKKKSAT